MALDTSVFNNIKTFQDYQKADQDFQMRKALTAQQLATGGIDEASKANIYKTQLLSGAAAGGQDAYDKARATLSAQGIDTSEYAPDVQTATSQLNQARLAQSPLGSLLNAGTKMTANDLAAVSTYGSMDSAIKAGYKPEGLSLPNIGSFSTAAPSPSAPQVTPAPAPIAAPIESAASAVPIMPNGQPDNVVIAPGTQPIPAKNIDTLVNNATKQVPTSSAPTPAKFNPPAQNPGESIAAYNQRVQQAFEAYKADPALQAAQAGAKAKAEALAKEEVTKTSQADNSKEMFDRLNQNLDALSALADKVPVQGVIASPATQAAIGLRLNGHLGADGSGADSLAQWNQINKQQILNGLQQLVQAGAIRSNKSIVDMLNTGAGIPADGTTVAGRKQMIETLRAEINNAKVAAGNQAADITGSATQSYQALPQTVVPSSTPAATQPPSGAVLYGTSGGKNVYKMPDGSFIMEQ